MAFTSRLGGTGEEPQSVESTTDSSPGSGSTPGDASETAGDLSKDVLFGLLSVRRRRNVLIYLDEVERATTLGDLSEHIAAKENEIEINHLSAAQRKRVYIALYQCHLPKMDDANVLDFDRERGTIEVRAEAEQLFPYLHLDPTTSMTSTSRDGLLGPMLLSPLRAILPG